MGENLAKAVGAEGRRDCLMMNPTKLVLVVDPNHVLYDPSVHEPLDEAFVENVRENGVMEPIECRRNGPKLEVVFGRKRVRAAQAAKLDRVPVLVSKGTDADFFRRMVSENEARKAPSTMTRAKNVETAARLGYTEDQVARMFTCSVSTIRNLRAFLDLAPPVQKAIESGKVNFAVTTKELAKLPREEQVKALDTLLESGAATRGSAGEENVRRAARGEKPDAAEPVRRMRNRKTLEKVLAKIPKGDKAGDYEAGVRDGVRLAMGDNVRKLSGYLE